MRSVRRCLMVLVCVCGLAYPARAQNVLTARPGGVVITVGGDAGLMAREFMTLKVHAGYGGVFRPGYWTPIEVVVNARVPRDLVGTAAETLRGTLRVTIATGPGIEEIHETAVEVPVMGERRYPFLLLPESDTVRIEFTPDRRSTFAGLIVGSGATRLAGTVRMSTAPNGQAFIVTMQTNERALRRTGGHTPRGTYSVAALQEADMPSTAAGWFGADALVLSLKELGGFTPAVQDAVMGWIEAGGHLTVTYDGPYAQLPRAIERALPASLGIGRQEVAGNDLIAFGGAAFPEGSRVFIAVDQSAPRGAVLLAAGGRPLITRRRWGSGTVVLMGASVAAPPFAHWDGAAALWGVLLPARPGQASGPAGMRDRVLAALLGFREVSASGLNAVLLGFAVYAGAVGGGLAALLRRLGRVELYWPIAGGVVLLVMLLALLNPAALESNWATVQTVSMLRARSGSRTGRLETFGVALATTPRPVTVVLGTEAGAVRAFADGEQFKVQEHTFHVTHAGLPVMDGVMAGAISATLLIAMDAVHNIPAVDFVREAPDRYRIRNRTGGTLAHTLITLPDGFIDLGPLSHGQEITLDPFDDVRYESWVVHAGLRRYSLMFPGLLGTLPRPTDIPAALMGTVLSPSGSRWFGASPEEPTLLAWRPLAAMSVGREDRPHTYHGQTLLVLTAEGA